MNKYNGNNYDRIVRGVELTNLNFAQKRTLMKLYRCVFRKHNVGLKNVKFQKIEKH